MVCSVHALGGKKATVHVVRANKSTQIMVPPHVKVTVVLTRAGHSSQGDSRARADNTRHTWDSTGRRLCGSTGIIIWDQLCPGVCNQLAAPSLI